MATPLERQIGRKQRQKRRVDFSELGSLFNNTAVPPAPGVPQAPVIQTLNELRGGFSPIPTASPGGLPNRPPVQAIEPAAPGVPAPPSNIPFPNRPTYPPSLASAPVGRMPQRPAPVEQMVRPSASAEGLVNFAGPDWANIPAAFEAARARSQSTALQPTVAPILTQAGGGIRDALMNGPVNEVDPSWTAREALRNVFTTGPQFTQVGGPANPKYGSVSGDWTDYIGDLPRSAANLVFRGIGEAATRTGDEARGILGVPWQIGHQLTTPVGQLQEEAAAAKAAEPAGEQTAAGTAVASQGPVKYSFGDQLQPNTAQPTASPQDVAGLAPLAAAGAEATAGAQAPAGTQAPPQAGPANWNALPPAALEMAQYWQSIGYSNDVIAGLLGAGKAESGFNPSAVGDGGTSSGIFQHHNERGAARQQFAQRHGLDPLSPITEAMFVDAELRGDPQFGTPATEGYAYNQLRSAHDPYTAAVGGLAYERPRGYQQGPGLNPNQVAGWNNRLQGTQQAYDLLNSVPLPPRQPAFQLDAPPARPNPIDQPLPNQPDFSASNSWLNQAAPTPVDPAAQRQRMFNEILSGIAQGNAAVDTRGAGGVGRLIAAWGKGATGGKSYADAANLQEQENFKQSQQSYAGNRAQVAQAQSDATTGWKNAVGQTGYTNAQNDQNADYLTRTEGYQTTQKNKAAVADANAANAENIYTWRKEAKAAGQPIQKVQEYGVTTINPDGTISFQRTRPEPTKEGESYAEQVVNVQKMSGELRDAAEANLIIRAGVERGDPTIIVNKIMSDVVQKGLGAGVFEQKYIQARKEAEAEIKASSPFGSTKPAENEQLIQDRTRAKMVEMTRGDNAWIQKAADRGVISAREFLKLFPPQQPAAQGAAPGG